jgi:hypothetical protein
MRKFALTLGLLAGFGSAASGQTCQIKFSVVWQDPLNNVNQGLSEKEAKDVAKKFSKKYPEVCYVEPSPSVPLVFYVTISTSTYHGTRTATSTQDTPVTGTVTDSNGNVGTINGTQTQTSTTTTPVQFDYPIFTLSIEKKQPDGSLKVMHNVERKGLCPTIAFTCVANRHPDIGIIEDAVKWIHGGGLTDPKQGVAPSR